MMPNWKRICRTAKRSLKRLETEVLAATSPTLGEVEVYKTMIAEIKNTFEGAQTQLEQQCSDEELELMWMQRDEFEDTLLKLNICILNTTMVNDNNNSLVSNSNTTLRLPKLNLPKFCGDIGKWMEFKDLFSHAIGDSNLPNVSKLQYLKSSLEGEAAELVQAIQLTELNYEVAWNLLASKYDNKRLNAFQLFQKLFLLPSVQRESTIQLKKLLNGLIECKETIKALKLNTFDNFLFFLVYTKLDDKIRNDFEMTIQNNEIPELQCLIQHITKLTVASEMVRVENIQDKKTHDSRKSRSDDGRRSYVTIKKKPCPICNGTHGIFLCPIFRGKSPEDRFNIVKNNSLCILCLKSDHRVSNCNDGLKYRCRCGKAHHYLLHFPDETPSINLPVITDVPSDTLPTTGTSSDTLPVQRVFSCINVNHKNFIVLPTALVCFKSGNIIGTLRVLLDSCSQVTMICDRFIKQYNLPTQSSSSSSVSADIVPTKSFEYSANFILEDNSLVKLTKFNLADPNFNKTSEVDLIVGAEYFERVMLPRTERINDLFLRETQFGWTLSGPVCAQSEVNKFCGATIQELENKLEQFWKLEDLPDPPSLTLKTERERCAEFFRANYSIAEDGKFMVKLPFIRDPKDIQCNRRNALAALYRTESKLSSELRAAYSKFLAEYESLGHISKVAPTTLPHYFMPHHAVLKDSSTTPLRVVFNASSSEINEPSLNELLLTGPSIQLELFDLLVNNRRYPFVFSADVEKMYRMIWVVPEHRRFQRILWRSSTNERISEYQLNTVTYGTVPASYLSTACLDVIASSIEHEHPVAAARIRENFFMDDIICGSDSVEEIVELQKVIHASLYNHGFLLRKYVANDNIILKHIDSNLLSNSTKPQIVDHLSSSILGLVWNNFVDTYQIKINVPCYDKIDRFSRRSILSIISRTFDPLGFLSPVTIKGKLILQRLWKPGQSWDDIISQDIADNFVDYTHQLSILSSFSIPRYLNLSKNSEMIGFCDASEKAYCAVVYIKTVDSSNSNPTTCTLLCSKTRPAPLKKLSVPRLELQAAVLLTTLLDRLSNIFKTPRSRVSAFTDSSTVLCWLSKSPADWKTFVHNRVSKVISLLPFEHWNYIPTKLNPADLATRGVSASEFLRNRNWIHGPDIMSTFSSYNSFPLPCPDLQIALEKRKLKRSALMSLKTINILEYFSSYRKLIKALCYLLRFVDFRIRKMTLITGPVDCTEFKRGLLLAIRMHQMQYFESEIIRLSNNQILKSKSKLLALNPYLDNEIVLRVSGRLQNSLISESRKKPIILSGSSLFTVNLCRYLHEKYFHANISFVSNLIGEHYWIVGGKNKLIKGVIRNCLTCQRARAEFGKQLMGSLSSARVIPSKPFTESGVDFAGPFECKCVNHRSTKFFKIYLAVFICLKTRAVHLETVSSLSTEAFISTLQRFISRRGRPASMFSDNGTNFVGTVNVLGINKDRLIEFGANENIKWTFIPPQSPHHGGIWEAAVKAAKSFLVKVTRNQVLNYEEYQTLFTRIEGIMNSRPLCYRNSNDQGTEVVTPGYFLVGSSLFENSSLEEEYIATTRRLKLLQNIINGFWTVWHSDYLHQLQQRSKWKRVCSNLEEGALVLVSDPGSRPFQWPLGKVVSVYPDKQGLVRVLDVLVRGKVKRRSINSVVPLMQAD